MRWSVVLVALGCAASIPSVLAQTGSETISLQARVEGVAGPTVNLQVRFYDAQTAGNQIGQTISLPNVAVQDGIFSVPIGVDPDIFDGSDRYVGLTVNSGNELTPRILVTSAPTAIRARTVGDENGDVSIERFLTVGARVRSKQGPGSDHAFEDIFADETIPNWKNGVPASFFRVAGAGGEEHGGFGMAIGSNIASPIVYLYRPFGLSAFQVRGCDGFLTSPVGPSSSLLFEVGSNGNSRTKSLTLDGFGLGSQDLLLSVAGRTQTSVLTITGGGDIAEPFALESKGDTEPLPGMVVSISRHRAGMLEPADVPYDTAVVGVISGAAGLEPGMVLEAHADRELHAFGEHPVAKAGRVWVRVDDSFGQIRPGDRLTTSTTPGRAMRVGDSAEDRLRSIGSVIGKVLKRHPVETDLVLMVVQPQ